MAHEAYIGVSGKARKVKKIYVGVGGKARNVKRGYIGVGGKARLFFKDTIEPGSVKNITSLSRAKYQMGSGELSNYAVFLGGRSNRSYYNDVEAYNSSLTKTTKSMQYKRNFMVSGGVATLSDRLITQPYCYTGGSTDIYFVSVFNNSLVESQIDPINEDDKYYTDTAVRQLGSNPTSLLFSVYYDVEGNTSDAYYIYTINQNLVFSNLNENGFFYGQTAATIENGVLSAGEFINKNLVINEFSSGSDVYCTAIPTLNNVMFIENDTSDSDIRTKIINNTTLVENEDFIWPGASVGEAVGNNGWGVYAGGRRPGMNQGISAIKGVSPDLTVTDIGDMANNVIDMGMANINNTTIIAGGGTISYNSASTTRVSSVCCVEFD